jgi:GH18 family chitinase
VRHALDQHARTVDSSNPPHFELTVACPAGAHNYNNLDIPGMDRYLDFWNLMAYDYAGSWDRVAGHQANLYPCGHDASRTPFSTEAAVQAYVSRGVAPDRIVMGMPLYGLTGWVGRSTVWARARGRMACTTTRSCRWRAPRCWRIMMPARATATTTAAGCW